MSLIKLAGPITVALKDLGKAIKKSFTPKPERVKDIVKKNIEKNVGKAVGEASRKAIAGQKAQAEFYNKKISNMKKGLVATAIGGAGLGAGGYVLGKKKD